MESTVTDNVATKVEDVENLVYKPLTYEKQQRLVVKKGGGKRESFFLYFSALTVDLITFASGCSLVWSSPAIPKLKSLDPNINPLGVPITPLQESWIASLPPLGGAIGPLLVGRFADSYGRRKPLIFLALLKLISFIVLAFATNMNLYYITRLLLGIGVGVSYTILPSYVGEICEDHNRGKFGCIMGVVLCLGILYAIAVGPLLSIKLFTLSCALPLVFMIICLVLVIPETPVYLAAAGKHEEATKALMKLRNKSREAAKEDLSEMLKIIEDSSRSSKGGYADLCKKYTVRKAFLICVGLASLLQISGINAIMSFIEPIFNLTGSKIPAYISAILVAAVQVLAMLFASVVVEKLGRRFLLLISAISCAVSLFILAAYFYLKHIQFSYINNMFWLPITTLIAYIFLFNIGMGPVPWAIVSEIFPANVKSTAASLITASCAFSAFSVTFLFPFIVDSFGPEICFCVFGGLCAVTAIFIYFVVPETRGMNIVEIQKMLRKTRK